jgi:tetratricopeptide (TPR) repeat protein
MGPAAATIGLCMIVKDEAAVIERCLASVRGLIDTWTICDTGSTDETPALVAAALRGIPGTLHERPWRDFGTNRSELMALARATADYLLLIDADMTVRGELGREPLTADAYLLRHDGDLEYWIPRLVRGDRRWRYEGATHEYLTSDDAFDSQPLETLVVEHHGDGGSRADKFERDRRLLEAAVARDPGDARAAFYLAQTLRDMGDDEAAIEAYERRVELGGWDEEVYYAAYQRGALIGRRDVDAGIAALQQAAALRPQRAEALHELARLSRVVGRHDDAYAYAGQGLQLPRPDDRLFVHADVHDWGLTFERAVAAYFVGRPGEALALNDDLLASGRLAPRVDSAVRENRAYCLAALGPDARPAHIDAPAPLLATLAERLAIGEVRLELDPPWPQFNPTVAADDDGLRMIVRSANYRVDERGGYEIDDDASVVRTINYLAHLDRELALRTVEPVTGPLAGPATYPTAVRGYEDLRLVRVGDRWLATATACDHRPYWHADLCLLEFGDGGEIARSMVLHGPDPDRHEKNWMPFADDGRLLLVYSVAPTVVLECDVRHGTLTTVADHPAPAWARGIRGGSQGVAVAEGRLFVVHEVLDPAAILRQYVHRFVLLDERHRLVAASPRFSFTGARVEMCLGLAARGDDLVMAFGASDRTAQLAIADRESVLDTLRWLP